MKIWRSHRYFQLLTQLIQWFVLKFVVEGKQKKSRKFWVSNNLARLSQMQHYFFIFIFISLVIGPDIYAASTTPTLLTMPDLLFRTFLVKDFVVEPAEMMKQTGSCLAFNDVLMFSQYYASFQSRKIYHTQIKCQLAELGRHFSKRLKSRPNISVRDELTDFYFTYHHCVQGVASIVQFGLPASCVLVKMAGLLVYFHTPDGWTEEITLVTLDVYQKWYFRNPTLDWFNFGRSGLLWLFFKAPVY